MFLCKKRETPHPRDGRYAWLVCVCSAFGFGVVFGNLNSFGVLLPVWSEEFSSSRGETAWIGSMATGEIFLVSPLAIKFNLQYGERIGGLCSSFANAVLLIGSSFVTKFPVLFITHGLLPGVFNSVTFNAFLFVVKKWFKKNLGLALGWALAGAAFGTIGFNPMVQALTDAFGWRNALRVLSGIWILTGLICLFFIPNVEKDEENENVAYRGCKNVCSNVFDCSLWRSSKYTMGMIVVFPTFFGFYVAMIHVISFAKDRGIPGSKASLLFIFIGSCSCISRVIIGKINDKKWLSSMQSLQVSAFMIGSSLVPLTQAKEYYHFIIFAVYYGLGSGAFITAQDYFFMTCFGDFRKDAAGYGMSQIVKSIPILVGAPIAGFMADHFKSYVYAFYMFGGMVLLSSILPFCLLLGKKETVVAVDVPDTEVELGHENPDTEVDLGHENPDTEVELGLEDVQTIEAADQFELRHENRPDTVETRL